MIDTANHENIKIQTNIDLATSNSINRLFGQIFLQIDQKPFPRPAWRDNIGALLRMWTQALIRIRSTNEDVIWPFMEGPYFVKIKRQPHGMLSLSFIEDREQQDTLAVAIIPYDVLRDTLKEQVRKALDYAHSHRLADSDIEHLSRNVDRL